MRALGDIDSGRRRLVHIAERNDFDMVIMTIPSNDPNQMLSTHDAAALLGLQPCTLAAWREDGSQPGLAFFKLGKAVRYRYSDLLAFIETRKASSTLVARQITPKTSLKVATTKIRAQHSTPPPHSRAEPPRITQTASRRKETKRREDQQQSLF